MITYFYLPADLSGMDPYTAELLMYFVFDFVLGEEGQALASNSYNKFVKIPDALKEYNIKTKAILAATLPLTGRHKFKTEFVDDTLIKTGMEDYYVSAKRRSYAEVERERIMDDASTSPAQVEALEFRVAELEAALSSAADDDSNDDKGMILGAVGLTLGFLSLLVALVALSKVKPSAKPRSQIGRAHV